MNISICMRSSRTKKSLLWLISLISLVALIVIGAKSQITKADSVKVESPLCLNAAQANARIQELYILASSESFLYVDNPEDVPDVPHVTEFRVKNARYLEEAIAISNSAFGKMSPQAAESYYQLGSLLELEIIDDRCLNRAAKAYARAIEIAEYLQAHPEKAGGLSLSELNKRLQRYLFDGTYLISMRFTTSKPAEMYAKAFALGKIPPPDQSFRKSNEWWRSYASCLRDRGMVVETAWVEAQLSRYCDVEVPSQADLRKQTARRLIGTFYYDGVLNAVQGRFKLTIREDGGKLFGTSQFTPDKTAYKNGSKQISSPQLHFVGQFKGGYLQAQVKSDDGYIGEVGIIRVGSNVAFVPIKHGWASNKVEPRWPFLPIETVFLSEDPGA